MADAKKCDRCGKFFIEDDLDESHDLCVCELVNRYGDVKFKDLCPSCSEALDHFMKLEPIGIAIEFKPDGVILSDRYDIECGSKHCRPMVHYEV